MDTSNWDRHTEYRSYGQEHQGKAVHRMEVLKNGRTPVPSLRLKCPDCQEQFWAVIQPGGGGKNTVVRDDAVHVQCPGCGAEWDGQHRRYFSCGLLIADGERVEVMGSVEAANLLDALRALTEQELIPSPHPPGVAGIQIVEINQEEHRSNMLRREAVLAMETESPEWPMKVLRSVTSRRAVAGERPDYAMMADLITENAAAATEV